MKTSQSILEQEPLTGWLENIPRKWDVARLRRLFRIVNGSTPSTSEEGYWGGDIPWITPDDLGPGQDHIEHGTRNLTRRGYEACGAEIVPEGSLILSTRAPIGYVASAANPVCTNQGCRALVPRGDVEPRFYRFVLEGAKSQLQVLGQGATFNELSGSELAEFWVPLPSREDQKGLADFLDEKTARIDELIRDKKRLIKRLEERRQSLLQQVVTSGIEDDVPTIDSGKSWIGEVPEHWQRCRVKYLGEYINGYSFDPDDWGDEGRPIIRIQNLTGESEDYNYFHGNLPHKYSVESGDILISWSASLGVHRWEGEPAWLNQHIFKVRLNTDLVTEDYFPWLAECFIRQMEERAHGSTMQHITRQKFGAFVVYLPPRPEQQELAGYLARECGRVDQMVQDCKDQIDALREYRTSLITATVTGQIDIGSSTSAAA